MLPPTNWLVAGFVKFQGIRKNPEQGGISDVPGLVQAMRIDPKHVKPYRFQIGQTIML